jgi:hypothetical protein
LDLIPDNDLEYSSSNEGLDHYFDEPEEFGSNEGPDGDID